MDRFDHHLLTVLGARGRASHVELATAVHLSPTAVARRQRALEESGIIRGYIADIDVAALGLRTTVVAQIALKSQSEGDLNEFEQAVLGCESVIQCYLMSGSDDYLIVLLVRDLPDYERVHKTQLSRLPHLSRIQSSFAMREVVRRTLPSDLLNSPS